MWYIATCSRPSTPSRAHLRPSRSSLENKPRAVATSPILPASHSCHGMSAASNGRDGSFPLQLEERRKPQSRSSSELSHPTSSPTRSRSNQTRVSKSPLSTPHLSVATNSWPFRPAPLPAHGPRTSSPTPRPSSAKFSTPNHHTLTRPPQRPSPPKASTPLSHAPSCPHSPL